jgi:hypothetical protein
MTTTTDPDHTKTWNLRLDLFEEPEGTTSAHAVLDTGDGRLDSWTIAYRNPHDRPVPGIGDEYAAGRALRELGQRLLDAGAVDAEENAHGRAR